MVDTIERWTDTIGNCRFQQTRHKGWNAGRLPAANQWDRFDDPISQSISVAALRCFYIAGTPKSVS